MKPRHAIARAIRARFEECTEAAQISEAYSEIRVILDGANRAAKARVGRPIGRPRSLVPHYTLVDMYITYPGAELITTAECHAPLTMAALTDLTEPIVTWSRANHAVQTPIEHELPTLLERLEFDLPRNGRPASLLYTLDGRDVRLEVRIVRSAAALSDEAAWCERNCGALLTGAKPSGDTPSYLR